MRSLIIVIMLGLFVSCDQTTHTGSPAFDGAAPGDGGHIPCENNVGEDGALLSSSADCPVDLPYCVLDWCSECELTIYPYQPNSTGIIVASNGCTDDEICDYTLLTCRPRLASECGDQSQCGRDEVCTCGASIPLLNYTGCECIPAGECLIDADCCYAEGYVCGDGACQDGFCAILR